VQILNNLGVVLQKEDRHAEALAYCARALRLGEVMLLPDDPRRIKLLLSVNWTPTTSHRLASLSARSVEVADGYARHLGVEATDLSY